MNISLSFYGILQATLMSAFVIASFLCSYLIKRFEISSLIKMGTVLVCVGSFILFLSSYFYPSPFFLAFAIACFNVGAAFLIAIFSTAAINFFTHFRGFASSLMGAVRMLMGALFIYLSSFFYNGTFHPLAWLIIIASICCVLLIQIERRVKA